jgi:glutamate formiminotransferase / 5-formyltetrahydrofolate cyclo-ligase
MKILECVPNFSEGRDAERISAIVGEIRNCPGVKLLDHSSDPDHNRTVVTFLGGPEAVKQGALRACLKAMEVIDMRAHRGGHPRIGAVDVVPFVPVRGMEMGEAVDVARRFGRELGEAEEVAVYFYGEAAADPKRRNLSDIRKGEYEGLPQKLQTSGWEPDAGSRRFNARSGAAVVGARFPLIAFNVNLRSPDLDLAKKIARRIRESSGGLPGVQALGVELQDRKMVQVSMNLTNYRKTSISVAVEFIRKELAGTGIKIEETELVGLLPLDALEDVVRHYLRLPGFRSAQVIETHILED